MKTAGYVFMVVGALLAIGLAVAPTSITILGTTGSCGAPFARVFAPDAGTDDDFGIEQGVIDQCVSQSWSRLLIGGILGGGAFVAGAIMVANAPKPRPQQPQYWGPPPPPPG